MNFYSCWGDWWGGAEWRAAFHLLQTFWPDFCQLETRISIILQIPVWRAFCNDFTAGYCPVWWLGSCGKHKTWTLAPSSSSFSGQNSPKQDRISSSSNKRILASISRQVRYNIFPDIYYIFCPVGQPTIWANQTSVAVVAALAGNLALVLSGLFLTNIDKIKGGKSEKY